MMLVQCLVGTRDTAALIILFILCGLLEDSLRSRAGSPWCHFKKLGEHLPRMCNQF